MGVLNINEFKKLAENGLLGDEYSENNFQRGSYDLRIGSIFKEDKIYSKDFNSDDFVNCIDVKPSEIVTILTFEKVTIPKNCMGRFSQ